MAEIIRCVHGHYFDRQKNMECPYCPMTSNEDGFSDEGGLEDGPTFAFQPGEIDTNIILENDRKSQVIHLKLSEEEPVKHFTTGWLVAVKGPARGYDFRILYGRNWIGSAKGSDIRLKEDPDLEPKQHCAIVYDGKGNRFYLIQGKGGITYLNEELLRKPEILKTGDRITIGANTFLFVPFCREGCTWMDE